MSPAGLDRDRVRLELRRAGKPFLALLVLVALSIACASIILGNIGIRMPWSSTYTAQVRVDDAKGVVPKKHTVRLSGIEIGRITKVELIEGQATLEIKIDAKWAPLYKDAKLRLRPETPLQDMYLDIHHRGTPRAGELGEDDRLAAERTRVPVDVGRILNVFNADTRVRVEQAIDELGAGLPDHGDDLRAALVELAPFLEAAKRLTHETAVRRRRTRRLIHNFRLMAEELSQRDVELARLVRGGAASLTELGNNDAPLRQVITDLPPTMHQVQTTFPIVRATVDELDPAFDELQPVARALPSGMRTLREFSVAAEPSLAALRRPLPRLRALVRELEPTAAHLSTAFTRLRPIAPRLDRITRLIPACEPALAKFFHNTISLGKFYDTNDAVIIRGQTVAAGGEQQQPNQRRADSCAPHGQVKP